MRTRAEVGFDAAHEECDLIVDGLIHYSAFPRRAWAAIDVASIKNLRTLHRHHHHNRPSMLGDRHWLARARSIGRPKPYFTSSRPRSACESPPMLYRFLANLAKKTRSSGSSR